MITLETVARSRILRGGNARQRESAREQNSEIMRANARERNTWKASGKCASESGRDRKSQSENESERAREQQIESAGGEERRRVAGRAKLEGGGAPAWEMCAPARGRCGPVVGLKVERPL